MNTQLVVYQSWNEVSITGEQLVSQPYNGSTGGIIFLAAEERIILEENAVLHAEGSGFRGATGRESDSDCNRFTSADREVYDLTDWRGSPRGEGVAGVPAGQKTGRAAAANGGGDGNGGGGGNDHNAGGGGGGSGGRMISASRANSTFNPVIDFSQGGPGLRLGSNECGPNDESAGGGGLGNATTILYPVPFGGFTQSADTLCGGEQLLITDASLGSRAVSWEVLPDLPGVTVQPVGLSLRVTFADSVSGTFRAIQTLQSPRGLFYPGDFPGSQPGSHLHRTWDL